MSKVIDLNEWRQHKEGGNKLTPLLGYLVWLRCPTCQSTEYTELRMQGGRVHKCGTLVEEVEVPIDIRAEYTISQRNFKILENLPKPDFGGKLKMPSKWIGTTGQVLKQFQQNEIEYQRRLRLIANEKLSPYPEDWDPKENGIAFKKVQPTGILITTARQADQHFPQKK